MCERILPETYQPDCWTLLRVPTNLDLLLSGSVTPFLVFPVCFPEERKQLIRADLMQQEIFLPLHACRRFHDF